MRFSLGCEEIINKDFQCAWSFIKDPKNEFLRFTNSPINYNTFVHQANADLVAISKNNSHEQIKKRNNLPILNPKNIANHFSGESIEDRLAFSIFVFREFVGRGFASDDREARKLRDKEIEKDPSQISNIFAPNKLSFDCIDYIKYNSYKAVLELFRNSYDPREVYDLYKDHKIFNEYNPIGKKYISYVENINNYGYTSFLNNEEYRNPDNIYSYLLKHNRGDLNAIPTRLTQYLKLNEEPNERNSISVISFCLNNDQIAPNNSAISNANANISNQNRAIQGSN